MPDFLQLIENWWSSQSKSFQESLIVTVIGGAILAFLIAISGRIVRIPSRLMKRNNPSDSSGAITAQEFTVPRPPHSRVHQFISRFDAEGRNIAQELTRLLAEDSLVTIWGSGGVGKTTLAIEVANELIPSFQAGIVWVNAHMITDLTVSRLQDEICTQLSWYNDTLPFDNSTKSSITRMLVGQNRCLIVVDNLESIGQQREETLLTYLDDLPCSILVTSRRRPVRGKDLYLGVMTKEESNQYIASLVKNSSKSSNLDSLRLEAISKIAGYNPQAIRWIIGQLELGIGVDIVLKDLERRDTEPAEEIFGRSFKLLPKEVPSILLAICLFASTASREALMVVCEVSLNQLNDAVRLLAQLDLILIREDRLYVLDLTKRLANIPDKFKRKTYLRLVEHYISLAKRIDYFTDPSILDKDYENLILLFEWLCDEEYWSQALSLFEVAGEFLTDRSGFDDRIRLSNLVLTAAKSDSNERAYAWYSVYELAWIFLREDKLDQALPIIENSLNIATSNGFDDVRAICLRSLGLIAQKKRNYAEAQSLLNESLNIWKNTGNIRWIAMAKAYLGELAYIQKNFEVSEKMLREANQIFHERKDIDGLAWTSDLLGKVMFATGNLDEAREYLYNSVKYREIMRAPAGIAHTALSLAKLEAKVGNIRRAIDLTEKAIGMYRQLGANEWERNAQEFRDKLTNPLMRWIKGIRTRYSEKMQEN